MGNVWGPSAVTFPDWVGDAVLDQRRTGRDARIAGQVGLDPEKWHVVGIDIGGGESYHSLSVVAVDRALFGEHESDVFPKIAAEHGGDLPVTEFMIHDVDPYEFLKSIIHSFEFRLRIERTQDMRIVVENHGDVPEPE